MLYCLVFWKCVFLLFCLVWFCFYGTWWHYVWLLWLCGYILMLLNFLVYVLPLVWNLLSCDNKVTLHCLCDLWQSAGNSSALFLTAAAQNLLCIKLAEELGVIVSNPWVTWFKAASLPAIVSLLLTPLILYKLYPPEIKDTPEAPALAAKKLESMGPVSKNEWIMIGTMLLAVSLWVFGYVSHIPFITSTPMYVLEWICFDWFRSLLTFWVENLVLVEMLKYRI